MLTASAVKKISQYGSVVLTTLMSFVLKPPLIYSESNSPIQYNNLYVFIMGVLSILMYDKIKNKKFNKMNLTIVLFFFTILIFGYGFLQNKYTRICKVDFNKDERVIISYSENFKSNTIKKIYDNWTKGDSNKKEIAINEILRTYDCNPSEIWEDKNIYFTYICFIVYYLSLAIILTFLLISVSQKIIDSKS